jgi:hypothetical protein
LFGTRRAGRASGSVQTAQDVVKNKFEFVSFKGINTQFLDGQYSCFVPIVALTGLVVKNLLV